MDHSTNMYYAQYESSIESEPLYDSDNSEILCTVNQSPSEAEYRQYTERRNGEILLHESWKDTIREHPHLAMHIAHQCGMMVDLKENRVRYIYEPVIHGNFIPGIKFKITIAYVKLLRKWFISSGHTRLPDIITLHGKLNRGVYDPIGARVLELIRRVKDALDNFLKRLIYIYQFIEAIQRIYKDVEFHPHNSLASIKILLKERGFPKGVEKTSLKDIIVLELAFNEDLEVDNVAYEYVYSREASTEQKTKCIGKIENRLQIFFVLPLLEAFESFMREEASSSDE